MPRVFQSDIRPCLPRIDRFVDTVAVRNIPADAGLACSDIHYVRDRNLPRPSRQSKKYPACRKSDPRKVRHLWSSRRHQKPRRNNMCSADRQHQRRSANALREMAQSAAISFRRTFLDRSFCCANIDELKMASRLPDDIGPSDMSGSKIPPESDLTNAKWYSDWLNVRKGLCTWRCFGYDGGAMASATTYDVVVIGAGVFGAWTAWHLDAPGAAGTAPGRLRPGHTRASSGGNLASSGWRMARMRSTRGGHMLRWRNGKRYLLSTGQPLFVPTGVLWCGSRSGSYLRDSEVLNRCAIPHELLIIRTDVRYPQINFDGVPHGSLNPKAVFFSRAEPLYVRWTMLSRAVSNSGSPKSTPHRGGKGALASISTSSVNASGRSIRVCLRSMARQALPLAAGQSNFSHPTGSLLLYQSCRRSRFASPALPTWFFQGDQVYGMPDIEGRGLKLARDVHGRARRPRYSIAHRLS